MFRHDRGHYKKFSIIMQLVPKNNIFFLSRASYIVDAGVVCELNYV